MMVWTNTNTISSQPLTAKVLIATLKRCEAELEAKFPKAERCQSIEVDLEFLNALDDFTSKQPFFPGSDAMLGNHWSITGLPVIPRFDVPRASWIANMADGSRVAHYPDGRKVRCIADSPA